MPARRLWRSAPLPVRPDGFEPPFTGLQPVVLPLDEGRMPRRCGPLAGDRFGVLMSLARPAVLAPASGVLHAPALLSKLRPDGTQPGIRTPHLPDVSRLQDRSAHRASDGADERNRTLINELQRRCSAIELHRQVVDR